MRSTKSLKKTKTADREEAIAASCHNMIAMVMSTGQLGTWVSVDPAVKYLCCDKCIVPNDDYGFNEFLYDIHCAGYDGVSTLVYKGVYMVLGSSKPRYLHSGMSFGICVVVSDDEGYYHSAVCNDEGVYLLDGDLGKFWLMCKELTQAY